MWWYDDLVRLTGSPIARLNRGERDHLTRQAARITAESAGEPDSRHAAAVASGRAARLPPPR